MKDLKKYWEQFKEFATKKTAGVPNYVFIIAGVVVFPLVLIFGFSKGGKKPF